ncbi:MAG: CBS domain-containing protein [Ignavibacteriae bacterium]|nr:CBS domain-containing protein [Ignavibacteriota bacterium]
MHEEELEDEIHRMYNEGSGAKALDSRTFTQAIKNLNLHKPVEIGPAQTVADAVKLMQQNKVGCVLVTEGGKMVGIFTERDILTRVFGKKDIEKLKVKDVMTAKPEAFEHEDSIAYVLNAMTVGGYRHVPVVDEKGKPVAVLSVKDIMSFIIEHFPEEVLNLPPEPIRKTEQREGA